MCPKYVILNIVSNVNFDKSVSITENSPYAI